MLKQLSPILPSLSESPSVVVHPRFALGRLISLLPCQANVMVLYDVGCVLARSLTRVGVHWSSFVLVLNVHGSSVFSTKMSNLTPSENWTLPGVM